MAPDRLIATTRAQFRRAAIEHLADLVSRGASTIVVDMSATQEMDAHGIGVLVLIQKRAREFGLRTQLLRCTQAVRHLLSITKLDFLFEFVD